MSFFNSPALRVMGDERGDVVEPIFARLQAQLSFVRLDEIMLDVRSFAGW